MSGSATTDAKVRSHLQPMNLQVLFEDADPLMHYQFLVGISDLDGNMVYDVKHATMGDFRPLNDNGALVFQHKLIDPRGGLMTLVALRLNQMGSIDTIERRHTCRYGKITNAHALFQASIVKSSQTDSTTASSNKDTIGGKVGASYGIVSGEVSGSREHQGPGSSTANAFAGEIRDFTVVWIAK